MQTKITFLALLCSVLSFGQVGTVFSTGGVKYKITAATTVEVTQNPGIAGAITLPSTANYNTASYYVTSIGVDAFKDCTGLAAVTIPNSVTSIGDSAFLNCSSLTAVTIPNFVTYIGQDAFRSCTLLTSITIPNSVKIISDQAFRYCPSLTAVTIPNSVNSIASYAFSGCTSLTSVTIPNSVTSISNGAFAFCNGLTAVTIPNSVISIGSSAFESCYGLTSVTIPNSVMSIGNSTFGLCTSLKSIIIPNSVTSIGDYAFALCNNLTSVTVDWTTPLFVNSKVFEYLTLSTITLNIPEGTETAYKTANVWNEFKISTLSTNHFSVNNAVKFYPNPTQSQINFTQEINTLDVFDFAGKKIKSFHNPSTTYDVTSLHKGGYILKGTTTDGKSINEKLVKE